MRKYIVLAGVIWIAVSSCQPPTDTMRLLDELVVSTSYDNQVNFAQYSTYSIATDTIGLVSNKSPNDTILTQGKSTYPRPVLLKVQSNMSGIGYNRVDSNEDADLRINVYVVNDFNLFQEVVYSNYSYPSYYGYGYGYGSFYGYPYVNTYATNTGSLVIEILVLKNITPDKKVRVIWSAYMGDVYSTIDLIRQSEEAIDQAFVQSTYLGK